MEHKWASLACCLVVLAGAVSLLPLIGTNFFPKDLHNVFTVNLFLAEGTPIRQTKAEAMKTIETIERLIGPDVDAYTTFVGAGGPRFWLSIVPEQPAANYAQILVHTRDSRRTETLALRLKQELPQPGAGGSAGRPADRDRPAGRRARAGPHSRGKTSRPSSASVNRSRASCANSRAASTSRTIGTRRSSSSPSRSTPTGPSSPASPTRMWPV